FVLCDKEAVAVSRQRLLAQLQTVLVQKRQDGGVQPLLRQVSSGKEQVRADQPQDGSSLLQEALGYGIQFRGHQGQAQINPLEVELPLRYSTGNHLVAQGLHFVSQSLKPPANRPTQHDGLHIRDTVG